MAQKSPRLNPGAKPEKKVKKKGRIEKEDLRNPGAESLIFKPSKVSWVVNSYLARQNNRNLNGFVYSVILVCLIFTLWASFSEKAIVLDATGEIISKSPPIPVSTINNMTVKSILVKDNQTVKKGDILVTSTKDLNEFEQKKILEALRSIEHNIELEKSKQCTVACKNELKTLESGGLSWFGKIESNTDLGREFNNLNKLMKEYLNQYSAVSELPSTTANLMYEIKSARQQLAQIKKKKAEKMLAVEYEQIQNRLITLESQLKEKTLNAEASLNNSRNGVEVSIQGIYSSLKTYLADSKIIAPNDGTVSFVELKGDGQTLSPGQVLFYINTAKTELAVKLKVTDTDISKIRKGMEAKLDISSYPASEFGVQSSMVTAIPEKFTVTGQQKDNTFEVFADLKEQGVLSQGSLLPLKSGVSLKAKIIIKHETLIIYYMKKLFSIKDDYLGG